MLDFEPPANLEYADYSNNQISKVANVDKNKYLKTLILDNNRITKIEGLRQNLSLRQVSLKNNYIEVIENLDGMMIEDLNLSHNLIVRI